MAGKRRNIVTFTCGVLSGIGWRLTTWGDRLARITGGETLKTLQQLAGDPRRNRMPHNWHVVMRHISAEARTVIEINCGEAGLSRNLAECGYLTIGLAANDADLSTSQSYVRSNRTDHCWLQQLHASRNWIRDLPAADVIIWQDPFRGHSFDSRGTEWQDEFESLLEKIKIQLFLYCPAKVSSCSELLGVLNSQYADRSWSVEEYASNQPDAGTWFVIGKANPYTAFQICSNAAAIESRSEILDVSMEICRVGLAQAPNGWHYLTEAAKEILSGCVVRPNDSILNHYYQRYQPATWRESYGISADIGLLNQAPIRSYNLPMPWHQLFVLVPNQRGEICPQEHPIPEAEFHECGPMREDLIVREFVALQAVVDSFRQYGYEPELHHDGYIRGFFMKRNNDYRFVITGGAHRIAVLAGMGETDFRAKFEPPHAYSPSRYRVVDMDDLMRWDGVRKAYYTPDQAMIIFNAIFDDDGSRIAAVVNCAEEIIQ